MNNDRHNDASLEAYFQHLQTCAPTATEHLRQRILAQTDETPATWNYLITWFAEQFFHSVWRTAATVVLPLALGFGLGFTQSEENYAVEPLLFADSLDTLLLGEVDEI